MQAEDILYAVPLAASWSVDGPLKDAAYALRMAVAKITVIVGCG